MSEALLMAPGRKRVMFNGLSQTVFTMGKQNILDTSDAIKKKPMLSKLWQLLNLSDLTLNIAKSAHITAMHGDGEQICADKSTLLQQRIRKNEMKNGSYDVKFFLCFC